MGRLFCGGFACGGVRWSSAGRWELQHRVARASGGLESSLHRIYRDGWVLRSSDGHLSLLPADRGEGAQLVGESPPPPPPRTSIRRRKSSARSRVMWWGSRWRFVFCWLPFYILNIVNLLVLLPGEFRGLYYFVVVLSYANSCANPILYGFLSDNFKRGFRKALCRSSRRVENQDQQQGTGMVALPLEEIQRVLDPKEHLKVTEVEEHNTDHEMTKLRNGCREDSRIQDVAAGGMDGRCERSISPTSDPAAVRNGARQTHKHLLENSDDKRSVLEISCL
ncbi:hypothetical protein cypCar_00050224 [Cyprinus carpio]|nr:hypothetical protein cypCar_00050224 [Cyprinus carpio]